jgi:transcriptional regulator with XRE-family HTH domain
MAFFVSKKSCQIICTLNQRYLFGIFNTRAMYLLVMKKQKPGPAKGQKFSEVKRSVFGTRLYEIRKRKGLTQIQLGERIGVSKRVIAFYEGNHSGPPPELLKKMSIALDITVSYLVGESPLKEVGVELRPTLRKYVDKLRRLPPKQQQTAFKMIDALIAESGISPDKNATKDGV